MYSQYSILQTLNKHAERQTMYLFIFFKFNPSSPHVYQHKTISRNVQAAVPGYETQDLVRPENFQPLFILGKVEEDVDGT